MRVEHSKPRKEHDGHPLQIPEATLQGTVGMPIASAQFQLPRGFRSLRLNLCSGKADLLYQERLTLHLRDQRSPCVQDHMPPVAQARTDGPQRLRAPLVPQLQGCPPTFHAQDSTTCSGLCSRNVKLSLVN